MSINLHYFRPTKPSWERKLSAIETFHCGMYPQGSFYFDGKIELNKFLVTMQQTLDVFDFLFCRLKKTEDGVIADYRSDNNSNVQLEIETFDITIEEISPLRTLPQSVDPRMRSGVTDDIEGLPMVAFKLTIGSDGFTLGYCINHTFIDQASLVYFIKYLSQTYSGTVNELSKPVLVDIENLVDNEHFLDNETTSEFSSLDEFHHFAERVGLRYVSNLSQLYGNQQIISNHRAYLHLDKTKMSELKNQTQTLISKNDIMHSILLKLYSEDTNLLSDHDMHFGFACNMRKYIGLGEEAIGNILHFPYFDPIKVDKVRKLDVIELAKISRTNVNCISVIEYQKKLNWFKQFYRFNEIANHYVPLPYVDAYYWGHTNWASFSYQDILFQESKLLALWTPPFPPQFKFTVTLFDDRNKESPLIIPINLTDSLLKKAYHLAESTGLFNVTLQTS